MRHDTARGGRILRGRRALALFGAAVGVLLLVLASYGFGARHGDASIAAGPRLSAPVIAATPITAADDRPKPAPATTSPASRPAPRPKKKRALRPEVARPANFAPVSVSVPSVGIDAPLIRLGLNGDHTLEVPRDPNVAGWFVYRSIPGDRGPGIIAGHVDSKRGPAVFYRLKDVKPGDTVNVRRSDGSVATFEVARLEEHDKNSFPTARVYGPTPRRELRLITCGGAFNRSTGHYVDNIIVFATLTKIA
jgi:sortase (surface protein transpeptidase)